MFDIGFWELTLLAVIALIVLGPERLPVVARTAGRWVGRARRYAQGLTSELEREVDVSGFREEVDRTRQSIESDARETFDDIESDARETFEDIESDTRRTVDDVEDMAADIESESAAGDPAEDSAQVCDDQMANAGKNTDNVRDDASGENGTTENYALDDESRTAADDWAEYGEQEPFSLERARADRAGRDRESQH